MGLQGRVALVTGGSRGLGHGIVMRLAREGADIAIFARTLSPAEEVAESVRALGRRAVAFSVDVTDREAVFSGTREVVKAMGRLDILVNNAGWGSIGRNLVDMDPAEWKFIVDVNLFGVFNCTRAAAEPMMKQRYGRVISIASDSGKVGTERQAILSAAKAGVMGFTRSLAFELAEYGIAVNCVSPSSVDTPLSRLSGGEEAIRQRAQLIPMKRVGTPEDVANAVAFFAAEETGYITGQVLSVNGGKNRVG